MVNRRALSNLGMYVYAAGAIALGIIGLVWSGFATNWQRVQENVPHRGALACIAAVYELSAGVAMLWAPNRAGGRGDAGDPLLHLCLVVGASDTRVSAGLRSMG